MSDRPWSFLRGVIPWIVWVLAFGFLEWRGLQNPRDGLPPLSLVIRRYVPGWLAFAGLTWLVLHFGRLYLST